MKYLRYLWLCTYMSFALVVFGHVQVNVVIDSTMLLIGDQSPLSLSVKQPEGVHVDFPMYADTLPGGLELVGLPQIDTLKEQGQCVVTHRYQVTAFEDSLYLVTSLPFVCEGETIWSDPVALKVVQPFEVDTASHVLADIKDVYRAPIYWWGIIRIILLVLLLAGLMVLGWWLYRRYGKKLRVEGEEQTIEETRDPWEVAIEGLERIKTEKLWQQAGRQKAYYTELTDVVRTYAEGVFGVNCMEMPSSEILSVLHSHLKDDKEAYTALKEILDLADLVKFAKWTALPDECEASLRNAYTFLERTHKEPKKTVAANETKKNLEA